MPSMLIWRLLGLLCASLFSLTPVSAFFMSSGLTHTHDENLNNAKSSKRQKLQATLEEAMSDAKTLTGDVVLRAAELVCKNTGATVGDRDVEQTFGLLRKLENSAFEYYLSTDEIPVATKTEANGHPTTEELAHQAHAAADALRRLMLHYGTSGGKGRKAIKDVANGLASYSNDSTKVPKALASVLVVSALAIGDQNCDDHRGLARAAASGVLPNKPISDDTYSILAVQAVKQLLGIALGQETNIVDIHIVTSICRSFVQNAIELQLECSKVVSSIFCLPEDGNIDENTKLPEVGKIEAAAALALSAQIGPWKYLKPAALVEIATDMNLWSAAERICTSAVKTASKPDCEDAILVLIESAGAAAQYRQMDSFATEFYDHGGRLKFAEARLLHAYDTITKVAARRQFPIIEKQIERVDRAFERIKIDLQDGENYDGAGPIEARDFAITKLVELGEIEAAHRLAKLWGRDFASKELERMAKARKEKYLQWEETDVGRSSAIPNVLSDPSSFLAEYAEMISDHRGTCVGMDCEFGDEQTKGVALLQLSTISKALLVDIPALSATEEGCKALQSTIGVLFAGDSPVVGFACGEDVRRLRASPSVLDTHWLGSSRAVLDIKPLIAHHSSELRHTGLSRACEKYLKKPLDKAEQCSLWMNRPLSQNQRAYAALDAFTCAAIYDILPDEIKNK